MVNVQYVLLLYAMPSIATRTSRIADAWCQSGPADISHTGSRSSDVSTARSRSNDVSTAGSRSNDVSTTGSRSADVLHAGSSDGHADSTLVRRRHDKPRLQHTVRRGCHQWRLHGVGSAAGTCLPAARLPPAQRRGGATAVNDAAACSHGVLLVRSHNRQTLVCLVTLNSRTARIMRAKGPTRVRRTLSIMTTKK